MKVRDPMRAMGVHAFGGAEAITTIAADRPSPKRGEVLVRLRRSGVKSVDVYMRSGIYGKSDTCKTPLLLEIV